MADADGERIVLASVATGGFEPHVGWVACFVLLLLAIALLPLFFGHLWESNRNKGIIAAALSVPVLALYLLHEPAELLRTGREYFSFIVLLWSLYTISGGIVLRGGLKGTPRANTLFLAVGAVMANVFGTTGAAMLLIRPLLRTNEHRRHKAHIFIFFTFLVANIGGCLTPLGDPPLFLGYLRGVPFGWTLSLFPEWLAMVGVLLAVFFAWDAGCWRREEAAVRDAPATGARLSLAGALNFLFISGVLCATLFSAQLARLTEAVGFGWGEGSPWREVIMITMGLLSMRFTRRELREENRFSFAAIVEVAVLFAGIFVTMIPALQLLNLHGPELGLTEPWQYFWAAGGLSSFLDNAPTYLVFSTAAASYNGFDATQGLAAVAASPDAAVYLKAVALGAVFMGANTYIGNAPNFMVKVIAETAGKRRVRMPSFFGYMAYSAGILVPLFVLVSVVGFVLLRSWQ